MSTQSEQDAFRRLQAFARKIAIELKAAGRPTLTANESIPVTGWRVYQCDMYSLFRSRRGSSEAEARWDSVWLGLNGDLFWATIEMHQGTSGAMPGLKTSTWQRWDHYASPLGIEHALALNGFPPWREKTYNSGGDQIHECHRLAHRAHVKAAPCQGISKMLSDLRAGNENRNFVLDWG
jgi:hypothetical protein